MGRYFLPDPVVWPQATSPTIMPTVTRIPRMQGLPLITVGFLGMRSGTVAPNRTPVERSNSLRMLWPTRFVATSFQSRF